MNTPQKTRKKQSDTAMVSIMTQNVRENCNVIIDHVGQQPNVSHTVKIGERTMLHNLAPLWDEALEGLLNDAVQNKESGLQVVDLQALSLSNAIRIGDILETLFLMTLSGQWLYYNEQGELQELAQSEMDKLFANGRISSEDLEHLTGAWRPKT